MLLIYSASNKLNNSLDFEISGFLENKKLLPVNEYSAYPFDDFMGYAGDLQKSYIKYSSNNFSMKSGRDYFLPGEYSHDRILFSEEFNIK